VQQEIRDVLRSADELDALPREERLRRRGALLDKRLELLRQRRQLDDALRVSNRQVDRLGRAAAEEVAHLAEAMGQVTRLEGSIKSKAGRAVARGIGAMSKRAIGRLLLRALPVVGWALAILDLKDAAMLIKEIAEEMASGELSASFGKDGGGAEDGADERLGKDDPFLGSSDVPGRRGKPGGAGPGRGKHDAEDPDGQVTSPYEADPVKPHAGTWPTFATGCGRSSRCGRPARASPRW
jgi:hypothetical protein